MSAMVFLKLVDKDKATYPLYRIEVFYHFLLTIRKSKSTSTYFDDFRRFLIVLQYIS